MRIKEFFFLLEKSPCLTHNSVIYSFNIFLNNFMLIVSKKLKLKIYQYFHVKTILRSILADIRFYIFIIAAKLQ